MHLIYILSIFSAVFATSPPSKYPFFFPHRCLLPVDSGMCRAAFENTFYNSTSAMCERFTYGGCMGNKNNFKTIDECQITCREFILKKINSPTDRPRGLPSHFPSPCDYPPNSGDCTKHYSYIAVYYNKTSKKCERFMTCEKNKNHFNTDAVCYQTCGRK